MEGNLSEFIEIVNEVEDTPGEYTPVPPGEYKAVIKNSEIKVSKNGSDRYLKVCWEIVEGPRAGRLIWEHFCLWYGLERQVPDTERAEKTRNIAKNNLAKLMKAAGFTKTGASSSVELHGIPVIIRLAVDDGGPGYGKTNKVKGYKPVSAGQEVSAPVVAAAAVQPAASAGNALPWE